MILKIDSKKPDMHRLSKAIDCLQSGGIIIYPTDTVYTLGCDIRHKKAYEKICQLKEVKPNKANFSMICYDLSHISDYTVNLSTPTYKMMNRLLPGPYTFILKANKHIQKLFGYKKKEVGIRVPNHRIPRSIVQAMGTPILSASLKNDDEILEYITDPEEIYEQYGDMVDMVIDGGVCGNIPSTIINYTDQEAFIVRQGAGIVD